MDWAKARLSEPSSYAAIAALIAAAMPFVPPQYQWIAQLLAALGAGTGFAVPEKK